MQIFHVHAKTRRPSPGEQAIIASVATRSEDACPARLQPIHKTKTLLGENDMHVHTCVRAIAKREPRWCSSPIAPRGNVAECLEPATTRCQ